MQKLGQERKPLMLGLPGTSTQLKDEESSLNIALPLSGAPPQGGAKRLTNMSKIVAVILKPQETPTDFYERLCEAFRVYTPPYLKVPENQQMVNMAFVAQSYTNILRKLQKLEGFAGMNATQLLEVANKVFVNWEHEEKEADKKMKAKVSLLAAAVGKLDPTKQSAPPWEGRPSGRTPLRRDQCAYCKEIGHWKNECP
jgi:hypothetical protein